MPDSIIKMDDKKLLLSLQVLNLGSSWLGGPVDLEIITTICHQQKKNRWINGNCLAKVCFSGY